MTEAKGKPQTIVLRFLKSLFNAHYHSQSCGRHCPQIQWLIVHEQRERMSFQKRQKCHKNETASFPECLLRTLGVRSFLIHQSLEPDNW